MIHAHVPLSVVHLYEDGFYVRTLPIAFTRATAEEFVHAYNRTGRGRRTCQRTDHTCRILVTDAEARRRG